MHLYDYTIRSHGHHLVLVILSKITLNSSKLPIWEYRKKDSTIRKIQCLDVKRRSERDIHGLYYGITSLRYILSLYRIKCIFLVRN